MSLEKPTIYHMTNADERAAFKSLCDEGAARREPLRLVDGGMLEALRELELLRDPGMLPRGERPNVSLGENVGVWVVYPWRGVAVRTLEREDFRAVRLSRNKNLITEAEQAVFADATIGIAGLNVGNPAAVCLAQEGVGQHFRMADNDALSLSNLNRFRAGLPDLGVNKAVLSARQAYEIDPYLEIDVWESGITLERISEFVSGLDLLIEEMDNMPLKVAIREEARRQRVPVIMVTGSGHDIILDVERFDREPELPLLSGKLPKEVTDALAAGPKSFEEKIALARDFMGASYLSGRLNASFDEVGKNLIGIPQIAEATFLRGATLAHVARGVLSGADIASGRYAFGLSDLYSHKK